MESTILYLILLYFYFTQQTIKTLWKSQVFQWILNQSSLKHEVIIENTLLFVYYIQQYSLGLHCIQICQQLIQLKAPIFLNSDPSFVLNINILHLLFLNQDKQNIQPSLKKIFQLKQADPLDYIIYSKQLDLDQMALIEANVFQKDITDLPFDQQIAKIKLNLKLVLQQIATDQYDKAELTYGDSDSKIFEIYLASIKKTLILHQNLKLFT